MRKRVKMTKGGSRRLFSTGARRTEPKNISPIPRRGGIRL